MQYQRFVDTKQRPNAIRRWKSVTLHLPTGLLAEFERLAQVLSRSRIGLIRESLEIGGLTYARGLLHKKERAAGESQPTTESAA